MNYKKELTLPLQINKSQNVLGKLLNLCWAAFIAIPGHVLSGATDVLHLVTPLCVQMLTMLQKVPLGTGQKCIHDQQRHVLILRWPLVGLATAGQVL